MRRRLRAFVGRVVIPLAAGAALTAGGIYLLAAMLEVPVLPSSLPAGAVAQASIGDIGTATASVAPTTPAEPELIGPPDRDVTPEGVTRGPVTDGVLVRIPPPKPVEEAVPKVDEVLFRRVVVLDAGSFRAVVDNAPVVVRIAGVDAPSFEQTCTDADGRKWACGARARAELARLIRNRAVACAIDGESNPKVPVGRCRVGPFDLAAWLVEQGWASPGDDAPPELVEAESAARQEAKGRFGRAPG